MVLFGSVYARLFLRLSFISQEFLELAAYAGSRPGFPTGSNGEIIIGYFVSVTGCDSAAPMADAAAVLKHSIHLVSSRGNTGGRYDYKMHAIYHPDAASCVEPLAQLGYKIVQRDTPVKVEEIKGDWIRQRIRQNGCCGEKEIIKLEASLVGS
jgi:hypothetical protein